MKRWASAILLTVLMASASADLASAAYRTNQFTNQFYEDNLLQINDNGNAVWRVRDVSDAEVSSNDGETRRQPTDNSIDEYFAVIKDNGNLVWKAGGHDGLDYEILIEDLEPDYSAVANEDAAYYGLRFLSGSGVFIGLTLSLLLIGVVIFLKILRRKEQLPSRARRATTTIRYDIRSA